MKHPFSILVSTLLSLCAASPITAQAPTQSLAGFVFANAIGIQDKADITANGKKLTTNGVAPGIASSGLGLPVGSYQLQVTAPGCETLNASIQLAVGTTPIVIAYLERVTDPKTNITKNFIRLLQFPAEPRTDKYVLKALSVDPTGQFSVTGGGQTQTAQFRKPFPLEGKKIKATDTAGSYDEATADEKGSYYCVLFRKVDGKVAVILIPERIYQW
jgi:hypothetical protein